MADFIKNLLAKNLVRAEQHPNALVRNQLRFGKAILNAAGSGLNAADGVLGAALAPGGATVGHGGKAVGSILDKISPRNKLNIAVGAPTALYLLSQANQNTIAPYLNQNIQEGRQVFAHDEEFIKKMYARSEKTAGEKTAVNWEALGEGLEKGVDAKGAGNAALGGISNMFKGRSGVGAGMLGAGLGMGAMGLLGGAAKNLGSMTKDTLNTKAYQLNKHMNPLTDRVKADELMATSFFSNLGSSMAQSMVGLLKDMGSKAVGAMQTGPSAESMLQGLSQNDEILSKGSPAVMLDAYHTMSKFAPTLSTDENAVRSFLREAVMAGSGPDYASIANLARAEKDIRDSKGMFAKKASDSALDKLKALIKER